MTLRDLMRAELNSEYEELEKELQNFVREGFEDLMADPFRLHISNIPFSYHEKHLKQLLAVFGPVVEVEIITNQRGSKGFGFVTMKNKSDALRAADFLNGYMIDGRKIEVNDATPRRFGQSLKKTNLVPTCKSARSSTSNLMDTDRQSELMKRSKSLYSLKSLPSPSSCKRLSKIPRNFRE